jgi:hypothetical protein
VAPTLSDGRYDIELPNTPLTSVSSGRNAASQTVADGVWDNRTVIRTWVWVIGGLSVAVIGLLTVFARRGHGSRDLGSVSGGWLAEHRASDSSTLDER